MFQEAMFQAPSKPGSYELTQANSTMSNWRLTSACGEVPETSNSVELGTFSIASSMPT